jgi:hypothetical protein
MSWMDAPQHRHQRLDAKSSVVEGVAGFFSTFGNLTVIKRDTTRLKPEIAKLLKQHLGVLLVVRSDELRHITTTQSVVQGVYLAGGGMQPEPLVFQWKQRGGYFPAGRGETKETYLWVVLQKNLPQAVKRAPAMFAPGKQLEIKVAPFEQL